MDIKKKKELLDAFYGRDCNIAIHNVWPVDLITFIGDKEALLHGYVESANQENKGSEYVEAEAWENVYFRAFGHASFQDDPLKDQAQAIYDNWTKKGFVPANNQQANPHYALYLLAWVIENPEAIGKPNAREVFEYAKTIITAWSILNEKP